MSDLSIGFSTPKDFKLFAWAIKKVLATPYSHVYISFFSSYYNRKIIYQSSGIAVNLIGEPRFNSIETIVAEFPLPVSEDLQKELVQNAIDTCGTPYGIKHIVGLVIYMIARKLGHKMNQVPFQNPSTLVCSQLAAKVLSEVLKLYPDLDPETATPEDIYTVLSENHHV